MTQEKTREELLAENHELRQRVEEAEEVLSAIRYNKVDAVVVLGPEGNLVHLLKPDTRSYRILVETMNEGTVLMTSDATIFRCNSRFAELVGSPVERITNSPLWTYVPEEEHWTVRSLLDEAAKGSCRREIHLKAGQGKLLPVSVSLNPLQMEDSVGFCLVITDLSEQKKNEEIIAARTHELKVKSQHLEEMNAALKILLKQREEDKAEFEEYILANVKTLVTPYLEKLKQTRLTDEQQTYCEILKTHLDEVISPFVRRLSRSYMSLTPMEIQVADLIKEGKSTKEIADILKVSENTVIVHRHRIRTKLGLKQTKVNLASHLKSLST
ncbi:MAG: PAS domain S-box protein [Desulfobacteraceae bacterium]|nr:MAG: PAS domain S-box protein [Desulfobacteraceae bacterium]